MIDLIAMVDVETTGLQKPGAPEDSQPHMLSISCKVVTGDRRRVSRFTRIIKPDGWAIEADAEKVHGISEAFAHQVGVPAWLALAELKASVENATRIVGHNIFGFDGPIIDLALRRGGCENLWFTQSRRKWFDTMTEATPLLKLPGRYDDWKYPTLGEAHAFFFPSSTAYKSSHDPEEDVDATADVYFAIQESRVDRPPVHAPHSS